MPCAAFEKLMTAPTKKPLVTDQRLFSLSHFPFLFPELLQLGVQRDLLWQAPAHKLLDSVGNQQDTQAGNT